MTKAPERIWGVFDKFGHGSTMARDQSQIILDCTDSVVEEYIRKDAVKAQIDRILDAINLHDTGHNTREDQEVRRILARVRAIVDQGAKND